MRLLINLTPLVPLIFSLSTSAPQSAKAQLPIDEGGGVNRLSKPAPAGAIIVRGRPRSNALKLAQEIAEDFSASDKLHVTLDDHASFGRFCDRAAPFHVLIKEGNLSAQETERLRWSFPAGKTVPQKFLVGQFRVLFVAHKGNAMRQIDFSEIGQMLRGGDNKPVGRMLGGSGTAFRSYAPQENTWARNFIRAKCMTSWQEEKPGVRRLQKLPFRDDIIACTSAKEIIANVAAERNGLGFFAWEDGLTKQDLQRVKVVPISAGEGQRAVAPTLEPTIDEHYPLAEPVYLWLHPDAPPLAREFCEFAVGREASQIAKKRGMWTKYEVDLRLGQERLAEVKKGHGQLINLVGTADTEGLVKGLALKFVEAKQAVRLKYQKERTSADAIASIKGSNAELLLIARDTTTNRETPGRSEKLVLGSVALGVIVHPKLGLESLSVAELRQICGGEIKEWPGVSGKEAVIRGYGLAKNAAVMGVLGDVVSGKWQVASAARRIEDRESSMEDGEVREPVASKEGTLAPRASSLAPRASSLAPLKLARCKDTAEVILSVARDPAAIGFVDLSQMPKEDGSVALVPIMLADGTATQVASKRVSEDYPLQVPYVLYLAPQAGEAARNFFTWLSETSNDAILLKHGLVPARQSK